MKCKYCKSKRVIKHGYRYSNRGKTQRYYCKKCKQSFSHYGKLTYRMRSRRWKLREALKLRQEGYTYSQIADKVGGVSRQTICRWIRKWKSNKMKKVIITRKMKNQYGSYDRDFEIKIPVVYKTKQTGGILKWKMKQTKKMKKQIG